MGLKILNFYVSLLFLFSFIEAYYVNEDYKNYECEFNTCKNNGLCLVLNETPRCFCYEGYTGEFCETLTDDGLMRIVNSIKNSPQRECLNNFCSTQQFCLAIDNLFRCFCLKDLAAYEVCELDVTNINPVPYAITTQLRTAEVSVFQPCSANVCQNSGYCLLTTNSFVCVCPKGFSGELCEINQGGVLATTTEKPIGRCLVNICKNGDCYITSSGFKCVCPYGFTGELCDVRQSEAPTTTTSPAITTQVGSGKCAVNVCFNNGICYVIANKLACLCLGPFTGELCESRINSVRVAKRQAGGSCNFNTCKNGGTCVNDKSGNFYGCFCRFGFSGTYCDQPYDCATYNCKNGGQCTPYGCKCPSGYSGKYCEVVKMSDLCKNYPCKNGGVCNVQNNKAECWCLKGTMGTNCEQKNYGANSCRYTLCFNGATCVERAYGTTTLAYCLCRPGFAGASCSEEYFRCTKNGVFADTYGCDTGKYFECSDVGTSRFPSGVLQNRNCPAGLRFNPQTTYCDAPEKVKC